MSQYQKVGKFMNQPNSRMKSYDQITDVTRAILLIYNHRHIYFGFKGMTQ